MSTNLENQSVRLTKTVVDKARPDPHKSQTFLRDSSLPGFALRISQGGTKAFIVEKRIKGRVRRQTLGRFGELTVEQARREAQKTLGKIAIGVDTVAERITEKARAITLAQAFEDYKKARKNLKPNTVTAYERLLNKHVGDWLKKPINEITKQMVSRRHREIGNRGTKYQANYVFRTLKAVLNFAKHQYEDGEGRAVLPNNPVEVLNHTRAWFPSKRRQEVIKVHQLAPWYQGVMALKHPDKQTSAHVIADYLLLVLFTGLRASEASTLRWEQIDFKDRTLTLGDPKNREPFTLPLSDVVENILKERAELAVNEYVFPNRDGNGPLVEARKQMAHVTEDSGVAFKIHDLRRTFITIAESLDLSGYTLKRLVNHKVSQDVTDGYIISDVERLRAPVQQVADFLKQHLGMTTPDNVISLLHGHR